MQIRAFSDEARAGDSFGDVVVFRVREGLDVLSAGLDCGSFDVHIRAGMMGFHEADMIEQKLVAPRRPELARFFEEAPDFGCGAVVVVGQDLDNDRDLVRRIAFEDQVIEHELVGPDTTAFLDGAFDYVAAHALPARLLACGKEPRIAGRVGAAHLGGNHDFLHEFSDGLSFSEGGDFSFSLEPLATHRGN